MKLISTGLLTASMVSYTYAYANKCLSPLINKGDCMAYGGKRFMSVGCDNKAGKKLKIKDGKLCAGTRCLMRKKNKRGKIKVKMSKKAGKNCVYFDYNQADNQLIITGPNDIKGKYPVFSKGNIYFNGKAGDVKCTIKIPTTAAPTTAAPTTAAAGNFNTDKHNYIYYKLACVRGANMEAKKDHPNYALRNYEYMGLTHQFHVYANLSKQECAKLCDSENRCYGFEYALGKDSSKVHGLAFEKDDCLLQSDPSIWHDCGVDNQIDLYMKEYYTPTKAPTTAAPTTAAPTTEAPTKVFWKHIPGRAEITQTGPNKVAVKKSDGAFDSLLFTSILFDKKVSYYTFQVVSNYRNITFGFGLRDSIEYEQWDFDHQAKNWINGVASLGYRAGTIAYHASDIEIKDVNKDSTPKAWIQSALDGKKLWGTSFLNKAIIKIGGVAKVEANETFVEFKIDGASVYKYFFKTGENTELYPVMDLYHPGDEYILTFFE